VLFQTFAYAAFLAAVVALFYALPPRWRRYELLVASYGFYATWSVPYVAVLAALTLLDYAAARAIGNQTPRRRAWLIGTVCANVALLATFKIAGAVSGSALGLFGFPQDQFVARLLVPLGLSIHVFQSIAYVVEVYRGRQQAVRNLADYALFIAFFPQLAAGPLVRAQTFFPQLYAWRRPDAEAVQRALFLIAFGLVKKLVCADNLARPVNAYFGDLAGHPGFVPAWSAAACFTLQIYFDLSGYTDIALGSALLLGFALPANFNRPWQANGIADFWHRWQMSVSTWFRDYVYIPLGGSRRGPARTFANLMLTMLVSGLWHGPAWHFFAWGAYHGGLLCTQRALGKEMPRGYGVVVTFVRVTIVWVLFRALTLGDAWSTFGQMFAPPELGANILDAGVIAILIGAAVAAWLDARVRLIDQLVPAPVSVRATALAAVLVALALFAYTDQTLPFISFQF
jgi:alginate O-acetyltransferase complex protein AlgI